MKSHSLSTARWMGWHWMAAFSLSLALGAYFLWAAPGLAEQMLWLVLFAGVIGVPHGLTDFAILPALARRCGWRGPHAMPLGAMIYVALITLYGALWLLLPALALLGFLLLAAWHFGEQDVRAYGAALRYPRLQSAARGAAIIVLPYLAQADTAHYFALLGDSTLWLAPAAWIPAAWIPAAWIPAAWVAAATLALSLIAHHLRFALETLLLCALLVLLPPLLSFTLYFALWHTPRHYAQVSGVLSVRGRRRAAACAIGLPLLAGAGLLYAEEWQRVLQAHPERTLHAFFIPLAALTFAHVAAHALAGGSATQPADAAQEDG